MLGTISVIPYELWVKKENVKLRHSIVCVYCTLEIQWLYYHLKQSTNNI